MFGESGCERCASILVSESDGASGVSQQYAGPNKGDAKRRKVAGPESDDDDDDKGGQKRERLADTHPQDMLVLGLPYTASEEVVRQYFEVYGPVRMVDVRERDVFVYDCDDECTDAQTVFSTISFFGYPVIL